MYSDEPGRTASTSISLRLRHPNDNHESLGDRRWFLHSLLWFGPYFNIMTLCIALQLLSTIMPMGIENSIFAENRHTAVLAFSTIGQVIQTISLALSIWTFIKDLKTQFVSARALIVLYVAILFYFSGLYITFFIFNTRAFSIASPPRDVFQVFVTFFYFSVSTMTTSGYGDIYPLRPQSKVFANLQMLISIVYGIGVFGVGLNAMATNDSEQTTKRPSKPHCLTPLFKWFRSFTWIEAVRHFCIRHFFLISMVLQFAAIFTVDPAWLTNNRNYDVHDSGIALLIILELFLFLLVILMAFRLLRQIDAHTVDPWFLTQCFLVTITCFAGFYFTCEVVGRKGTFYLVTNSTDPERHYSLLELIGEMIYFSITTMVLCGYGDIYPQSPLPQLLCSAQMVFSVLFTAIILGLAVSQLAIAVPGLVSPSTGSLDDVTARYAGNSFSQAVDSSSDVGHHRRQESKDVNLSDLHDRSSV